MICKKCGARFSDGMFCPECGTSTVPAMGIGGNNWTDTWEAALEYSEKDGYNTKMYGPQGQLKKQVISRDKVIIEAGSKRVFENKMFCFDNDYYASIEIARDTKVEFRNCTFILNEEDNRGLYHYIHIKIEGTNANLNFENCCIKGSACLVESGVNGGAAAITFRNCAFDGKQISETSFPLIKQTGGNIYFENCFIKERYIINGNGTGSKIKLRNCVIINQLKKTDFFDRELIQAEGGMRVAFENCYIRSKTQLVGGKWGTPVTIKASYIDNYSYK